MSTTLFMYFPLWSERKSGIFRNIFKTWFVHVLHTVIRHASFGWLPNTTASWVFWSCLCKQDQNKLKLCCHMDCYINNTFFWANEIACWVRLTNSAWTTNKWFVPTHSKSAIESVHSMFYFQGCWPGVFGNIFETGA